MHPKKVSNDSGRLIFDVEHWLIVSRFGAGGCFVTVSVAMRTPPICATGALASVGLMPAATLFGVATPSVAGHCGFAFARELPEGIPVAGHFLPATGKLCLRGASQDLSLKACGQLLGDDPLRQLLIDAAEPSQDPGHWQLRAERAPWVGEFVEPAAGVST